MTKEKELMNELIKLVKDNGFYLSEKEINEAKKYDVELFICQTPENDGGWTKDVSEVFSLEDREKFHSLCKELNILTPWVVIVDEL